MKYGTLVYINIDGRVLMMRKATRRDDPNSGYYTLPGGKLGSNERKTPEGRLAGAVRETEEETGLRIISPIARGVILFNNKGRIFDNWPNPEDFLVYIFATGSYTGELRGSEEGTPVWIDEKEIPLLPKNSGDAKVYEWLKNPRSFQGVIKHKGKALDEFGTFVEYL
ncbi:MAG: NUDIX domain-containing protein [Nanoarchaeota archaeon]